MMRSTEIIPAIRTDHDAILLETGKLENGQKGPGYWKLNCSLLADDAYVNSVTELLPVWAAEGRKELTDHKSVWDWIKYNIRAHAINFSKRKSKERYEKEKTLQEELSKAKDTKRLKCVTISSCSGKIGNLPRRKNQRNHYTSACALARIRGKKHQIFSQSGEKKSRKETCTKTFY